MLEIVHPLLLFLLELLRRFDADFIPEISVIEASFLKAAKAINAESVTTRQLRQFERDLSEFTRYSNLQPTEPQRH